MGQAVARLAKTSGHTIVSIENADVAIEFSHADAVQKHVTYAMMHKKPIVVGTTGWESQRDAIISQVKSGNGALLYGANFATGVHLLSSLVRYAEAILRPFDFDISVHETHHIHKKDSPSGTALQLQKLLHKSGSVPISSERTGEVVGEHSVEFDSVEELIEIKHSAKTRDVFAKGALLAAEWLVDREGIYTFTDCIQERMQWSFKKQSQPS